MKLIEEKLHRIHAEARERTEDSKTTVDIDQESGAGHDQGFAKVNLVSEQSPAALAVSDDVIDYRPISIKSDDVMVCFQGLMVDDVILEFGSIKKTNFSSLQDILSLVGHSQGVRV